MAWSSSWPIMNFFIFCGPVAEIVFAVIVVVEFFVNMICGWVNEMCVIILVFREVPESRRTIVRFFALCGLIVFLLMVVLFWMLIRDFILVFLIVVELMIVVVCCIFLFVYFFMLLMLMVRSYVYGLVFVEQCTSFLLLSVLICVVVHVVALIVLLLWLIYGVVMGVIVVFVSFIVETIVVWFYVIRYCKIIR